MFEKLFKIYDTLIFFDTETTGLTPVDEDQMIELAAIAIDRDGNEKEMDKFIQLYKYQELPENITSLTGIIDLTLATEGVDEANAVKEFWDMASGKTLLVAHNAQFDLLFLAMACHRIRQAGDEDPMRLFKEADYLDTLTIYRDRHTHPHKLENAIGIYGLTGLVENSHRAIDDTRALYEVAKKMEAEDDNLDKYINVFGWMKKYGPAEHKFKKVKYAMQDFKIIKPPAFDRV